MLPDTYMQKQVSQEVGDGIIFHDGGREVFITSARLEHIRSHVTTHEGEELRGKAAQKYMDRYSEKYLGKDLAGSYKNRKILGE